ncbi:hypothetical protein ACQL2C_004457 [Yersinia enterocolitica]
MDITKSREDFEVNYAKKLRSNFDRNIYRTDRYVSLNVQAHWETWQASRESLVVILPKTCRDIAGEDAYLDSDETSFDYGVNFCAEAIRDAGIRIKGESE